jgi:hypothetical protein
MKFLNKNVFVLIALASVLFSCEKEKEDVAPPVEEANLTSYAFTRNGFSTVEYSGQTTRMNMFDELSSYISLGNNGITLSVEAMNNMFKNENAPFADPSLNASSKNISSKTYVEDTTVFEQYFTNLAKSSKPMDSAFIDTASMGTAGLLYSNDFSKHYLVDSNGVEWKQLIVKELMGAFLYYQITSVYLSADKIGSSVDNSLSVTGKYYTTMEHHFDEAFGYLGVPTNFPTNKEGIRYYGSYADQRNVVLGLNSKLMDAFIKGRQAIVDRDMAAKWEAVAEIKTNLELVIAGSAIHYLNEAIANFGDNAIRCHTLSECLGFVKSLKYNIDKTISNEDIASIEASIGMNFYEVSVSDLNAAKTSLSSIFQLDDSKDIL